MTAQQQDQTAAMSHRDVQVEDSPPGAAGAGAAHAPPATPKPPGRRPFMEQFDLTPNRDGKTEGEVEEMEKKIADLEAITKELLKNKDYNRKELDIDDGTLKPLHSKDMKPTRNLDEPGRNF